MTAIQPSLFGDEIAPVKRRAPAVKIPKNRPAKWSTNTTKATCYRCVQNLADGKHIDPRRATWRRETGTLITLLCYEHAEPVRAADHEAAQRLEREAHAVRATTATPTRSRPASPSTSSWDRREESTWLDRM